MIDSIKTGAIFGAGSAVGMSAIVVGHMMGFFGLPFMVLILVPAGLLVGGAIAGSTIDRDWPGAVPRFGMTFVVGGFGALLSLASIPYQASRELQTTILATWFIAAFVIAGMVASVAEESRPCSIGRVLVVFAAAGLVGSAGIILAIHFAAAPTYVAVPIGVIAGFTAVGALVRTCFVNGRT